MQKNFTQSGFAITSGHRHEAEFEANYPFSLNDDRRFLTAEITRLETRLAGLPVDLHDNISGADTLAILKQRLRELETPA